MSSSSLQLTLMVGKLVPVLAPASLVYALRRAEVTSTDNGPSGFQLSFQITRGSNPLDYDLTIQTLLAPFNRVILMVTMGGVPTVIMDGLITRRELIPRKGNEPDTMVVTGEDISVAMDLEQKTLPYPAMDDMAVAEFILAEYVEYGLIPLVYPTMVSISMLPEEVITQQSSTDRAFLQFLASRNGYVFQIIPGPVPFTNTAYFGPPKRLSMLQSALTVNELPVSNVQSLRFTYDALAHTTVVGMVQDTLETDLDIPIVAVEPLLIPPLAAVSPLITNAPYFRLTLLDPGGMDPIQAEIVAEGMVNNSAESVLTAEGELDVLRYGSVLTAPGLVGVRGAGWGHDGLYYVKQVTHQITPETYTQSFTLTREGLGSTVPMVMP